ncbi:MAG TPA: NAD(P)-binding domain-containing protein [Cytophagaceae bacterium]
MMREVQTIIIGAGQAGLSVAYWLQKSSSAYLILEAEGEAGASWRNRYDSLRLFTPARYSSLPGLSMLLPGRSYPNKEDVVEYLNAYARKFNLKIKLNCRVNKLEKRDNHFVVHTNSETYICVNVVVATGAFQDPFIPLYSSKPADSILQLHSSEYRNPGQLKQGPVLVVGAGNSAAQIAEEVSVYYPTYMVVRDKIAFAPSSILGVSIFFWLDWLGLMKAPPETASARLLMRKGKDVYANELKQLIKEGKVLIKPFIKSFEDTKVIFTDGTCLEVSTIIWATGFRNKYDWIAIPGAKNDKGELLHRNGISFVDGLYFIGLPWQTSRGSSLLLGVGRDAQMIVETLLQRDCQRKVLHVN